eukprot:UN17326
MFKMINNKLDFHSCSKGTCYAWLNYVLNEKKKYKDSENDTRPLILVMGQGKRSRYNTST